VWPDRALPTHNYRLILNLIAAGVVACQPAAGPSNGGNLPVGAPSIQLYVEPDEGAKPVVQFIDSAKQTLDVGMYLLSDRPILSAIDSAKRRGVQVRVMLEEHPYGEGMGNGSIYQRLQGAGILVAWSPSNFKLSHDKYAVADHHSALLGTPNWTTSAFSTNREYVVVDQDPADVAQLAAIYEADWNRHGVTLDNPHLVVSPANSRADFLALIQSAQKQIDLEAEELQDQEIEDALGHAAQRGVVVRAIIPTPSGGADANEPGQRRLAGAGVKVRRLEHPYIHAKAILVDGQEAFVGSENISSQSLDQNREVGIVTVDRAAVARLEQTFSHDWASAS
jgi:phosphatidylserine/phosphatidylglycerophosphate/cardiolipin synthase-like enzyme